MRNQKTSAFVLGKLLLTIAFLAALCSPMKAQVTQKELLPGVNRLLSQQVTIVGPVQQWNLSIPAGGTAVVIDVESTLLANSFNYSLNFATQAIDNPNVIPFSAAGPALTCYKIPYNLSGSTNPPVINVTYNSFIAGIFAHQFVCPVPATGHLALTFQVTAGAGSTYSLYTNVLMGPMPLLALPYLDTSGGIGIGGNRFTEITTNATTILSNLRAATILSIQVNNPGTGWTFQVFDSGSCAVPSVATSSALISHETFVYNAQMNFGLCIQTAGTTPGSITVSWRN